MKSNGGKIPPSIFLTFFRDATERLNNHPSTTTRIKLLRLSNPPGTNYDDDNNINDNNSNIPLLDSNCQDDYNAEYSVPLSLQNHRAFLMEEQVKALQKSIPTPLSSNNNLGAVGGDDNGGNDNDIVAVTLENVQSRLRELGSKDLSNVNWDGDEKVKEDLFARMEEMNDAARLAFARSVLWAELKWMDYFKRFHDDNSDNEISSMQEQEEIQIIRAGRQGRNLRHTEDGLGPMDRSAIIEFCGLCGTAVRLPEVIGHLQDGRDIFPIPQVELEDGVVSPQNHRASAARQFLPQYRIRNLQHMILRALGYDHEFGAMEIRSAVLRAEQPANGDAERDSGLDTAVVEFSMALQEAGSNAMNSCLKDGLSDRHEGGVTRVTSVKYTENVVHNGEGFGGSSSSGGAPSHERMEQHSEDNKMMQLSMAQKAAALQHSILTSLMDMEEEQRDEQLKEAKAVHEEFMKGAMELPIGPQRVDFIQNISPEKQKMLLIYKLWGQIQNKPSFEVSN